MKKLVLIICGLMLLFQDIAIAGSFQEMRGMFYKKDDGNYARDEWLSIDTDGDGYKEWYFFNAYGFKISSMNVKGYELDEQGRWVINGQVQYDTGNNNFSQTAQPIGPTNNTNNMINQANQTSNINKNTTEDYIVRPTAEKETAIANAIKSENVIVPTETTNNSINVNQNTTNIVAPLPQNNDSSQNNTSNIITGGNNSSGESKKVLYNNIDAKSGITQYETKRVCGKSWVNVIGMNGNNSYIKTNSGKFTCLSMEVGINNIKDNASYSLSIYVNGDFLETIEDFSNEPETYEFFFDPNSTIMIVYNAQADTGTYLSTDNKYLYIRNGRFSDKKEK